MYVNPFGIVKMKSRLWREKIMVFKRGGGSPQEEEEEGEQAEGGGNRSSRVVEENRWGWMDRFSIETDWSTPQSTIAFSGLKLQTVINWLQLHSQRVSCCILLNRSEANSGGHWFTHSCCWQIAIRLELTFKTAVGQKQDVATASAKTVASSLINSMLKLILLKTGMRQQHCYYEAVVDVSLKKRQVS